jgi:hypothetical protein
LIGSFPRARTGRREIKSKIKRKINIAQAISFSRPTRKKKNNKQPMKCRCVTNTHFTYFSLFYSDATLNQPQAATIRLQTAKNNYNQPATRRTTQQQAVATKEHHV